MTVAIHESGVTFGDFEDADIFLIEQAVAHSKLHENGVKSVEFVLRQEFSGKHPVVSLVEAKSSIPRDAKEFFNDVRQKMTQSLAVWFCAVLGRHSALNKLLPDRQHGVKVLSLPLKLILVVPKAPDAMLPQLTDQFRQALRTDRKCWAIEHSAILVLNESRAIKHGLVKSA
jgi:hypothetical protein